jgi:iron complex transport system substrate-binding protein
LEVITGVLDKKYIHNSTVLDGLKKKRIQAFGNEEMLRFESIVNSKAEVLIYSGFGQDFPHSKQLEKAGIICLSNYDWKENHPLGRAEWIKLFGYLIGKKKKAKSYFSSIEKEYLSLKKEAKKLTSKPTVLSGNVLGDFWYAPAGESYFAELFRDAQVDYLYSETNGTGSVERSLERVLAENRTADFWLNAGFSTLELVQKSNKKASYIEAFSKGKTYCYSPNMNLFWEMSAIEPHHVLSDLLRILHPEFKQKTGMYFYQKLN